MDMWGRVGTGNENSQRKRPEVGMYVWCVPGTSRKQRGCAASVKGGRRRNRNPGHEGLLEQLDLGVPFQAAWQDRPLNCPETLLTPCGPALTLQGSAPRISCSHHGALAHALYRSGILSHSCSLFPWRTPTYPAQLSSAISGSRTSLASSAALPSSQDLILVTMKSLGPVGVCPKPRLSFQRAGVRLILFPATSPGCG